MTTPPTIGAATDLVVDHVRDELLEAARLEGARDAAQHLPPMSPSPTSGEVILGSLAHRSIQRVQGGLDRDDASVRADIELASGGLAELETHGATGRATWPLVDRGRLVLAGLVGFPAAAGEVISARPAVETLFELGEGSNESLALAGVFVLGVFAASHQIAERLADASTGSGRSADRARVGASWWSLVLLAAGGTVVGARLLSAGLDPDVTLGLEAIAGTIGAQVLLIACALFTARTFVHAEREAHARATEQAKAGVRSDHKRLEDELARLGRIDPAALVGDSLTDALVLYRHTLATNHASEHGRAGWVARNARDLATLGALLATVFPTLPGNGRASGVQADLDDPGQPSFNDSDAAPDTAESPAASVALRPDPVDPGPDVDIDLRGPAPAEERPQEADRADAEPANSAPPRGAGHPDPGPTRYPTDDDLFDALLDGAA